MRAEPVTPESLAETDNDSRLQAVAQALGVLAPLLDRGALQKTGERAIAICVRRLPSFRKASVNYLIRAVLPFASSSHQEFSDLLDSVLTALDRNVELEDGRSMRDSFDWLSCDLLSRTRDVRKVAPILTHPCCVGKTRLAVLRRLEELAYPPSAVDSQQAVAESVVTGLSQPLAGGLLAAGRQAQWEMERKFRTTWNAVAWLREHHPEIDLDAPYKPKK